ncbi:hypothetical protein DUI87_32252 [Hirundo rustica rustica]|uniref:Uncharacterized protein n=1 Tax=Hirundo rustica rustica TaxID=333673 RepID=A0A3M0IQC3_HIRRU|nr:hypothetical protein DUI87_32252 [Hirundo rustica rustica]
MDPAHVLEELLGHKCRAWTHLVFWRSCWATSAGHGPSSCPGGAAGPQVQGMDPAHVLEELLGHKQGMDPAHVLEELLGHKQGMDPAHVLEELLGHKQGMDPAHVLEVLLGHKCRAWTHLVFWR